MHQQTLSEIVGELSEILSGRFVGRVFQLSPASLAIDFGLQDEGYLFISCEPATARMHLIKRAVRELRKSSAHPSHFAQSLGAKLGGAVLTSITKAENERIVFLDFTRTDEANKARYSLVAQLTGRSANLFLLDTDNVIVESLRKPKGAGQQAREIYKPPKLQSKEVAEETCIERADFPSLSAAVDAHYREAESIDEFDELAKYVAGTLRKEANRLKKLKANLAKDLVTHGNQEQHKKFGDLLLANIATATRKGRKVTVQDYYQDGAPMIEIEVDEEKTLPEQAAEYFSRFTKAKRASEEIAMRVTQVDRDLASLEEKQNELTTLIEAGDIHALRTLVQAKQKRVIGRSKKEKSPPTLPGMRRYLSSDGYEVIVGRTARDNDALTFRVARPNDLWLHAGDYPGSHVIVRNSSRKDIPHRTLVEAAQLAAKFSQASKDSKVTIHYSARKFLSKPKGAAPGLVRMSNYKTINVAPGENIERLK